MKASELLNEVEAEEMFRFDTCDIAIPLVYGLLKSVPWRNLPRKKYRKWIRQWRRSNGVVAIYTSRTTRGI